MHVRSLVPLLLIALSATSLVACRSASRSAADLNQTGNQQYDLRNYAGALETYLQAEVQRPDIAALNYNAGNALYQQNNYQRTITEDQQAAQSTDASVQDHAYYSMGNAFVAENQLQDAVDAYKSALRANPSDLDAKYNLEVIQRQIDQEQARQQQTPPAQQGQGQGPAAQQAGAPQAGAPNPGDQGQPGATAQNGQPGSTPAASAQSGGQGAGTPGGPGGSSSGYTGTPDGQAAALDPNLKQALGQFDQTGNIDSALQALDILARQQQLEQSGNSPPPDPKGRDW